MGVKVQVNPKIAVGVVFVAAMFMNIMGWVFSDVAGDQQRSSKRYRDQHLPLVRCVTVWGGVLPLVSFLRVTSASRRLPRRDGSRFMNHESC